MMAVILLLLMLIPLVLIGVYTYNDAERRDMNAAAWTLIVILAPALTGFIIYLILRGNYSDLKCPRCGMTVKEQYAVCPHCGTRLRPACPHCGTVVERNWKVCPSCAAQLPEEYENVHAPEKRGDKAIGKILMAVVIIAALLVITVIIGFTAYDNDGGWSTAAGVPLEEIYAAPNGGEVRAWAESIDEKEKAICALEYSCKNEESELEYRYLIYSPDLGEEALEAIDYSSGGLFADELAVRFSEEKPSGKTAYYVEACYDKKMKLRVYVGGAEKEVKVTEAGFDPVEGVAAKYF